MSEASPTVIREVVQNVLADSAFLLVEPAEQAPTWPEPSRVLHARLDFGAPHGGCLVLAAPSELAESVASDMLGLEPGDPEAALHSAAALAELANILAGALLARLYGTAVDVALGLPQIGNGRGSLPAGTGHSLVFTAMDALPVEVHLLRLAETPE